MANPHGVDIELDPRGPTFLRDPRGVGVKTLASDTDALPKHATPSTVQVIVLADGAANSCSDHDGPLMTKLTTELTATGN